MPDQAECAGCAQVLRDGDTLYEVTKGTYDSDEDELVPEVVAARYHERCLPPSVNTTEPTGDEPEPEGAP